MNVIMTLLEKEWLEHKVVTRVPLFLLFCGLVMLVLLSSNAGFQSNISYELSYNFDDWDAGLNFGEQLSHIIFFLSGMVSILLSTLYFPKTLRKERLEGSLMFWRSMPISDGTQHAIKLIFGLLIVPVICSILVISTDIIMWATSHFLNEKIPLFWGGGSLWYVLTHWLEFIFRMWAVGIALLPLAILAMAISQRINSPLLIMLLGFYVLKLLSSVIFGDAMLSQFLRLVMWLPINVLTEDSIYYAFTQFGTLNLCIYFLLGVVSLLISLRLSRTVA